MRSKFSKIVLVAPLGLALTFTFSCSDLPDFQETPVGGSSSITESSSSKGSSSSATGSSSSISRSSSSSVVTGSSSSIDRSSSGSVVTGSSSSISNSTNGTFKDSRDNKPYKWVKIGTQTWMAENLNYNASGSVCYENNNTNCTTYGRLYSWETAKTACPTGWHLPSAAEWNVMLKFVDKTCGLVGEDEDYEYCKNAGNILKADEGWDDYEGVDGNGVDKYGFSALPGGGADDEGFETLGYYGFWWGSNYNSSGYYEVYTSSIGSVLIYDYNGDDTLLYSVRCMKD